MVTAPSPKYAKVESERKFLLRSVPAGAREVSRIVDRYLHDSRLRLRQMTRRDGTAVRKLGQKIPLGPVRVLHTTMYLDDADWAVLAGLPGAELRKTRHHFDHGVAVDVLADGTVLAEIDGGESLPDDVPAFLDVIREVTGEERWTGAALARAGTEA
jgi:CYTH domain-containing protein